MVSWGRLVTVLRFGPITSILFHFIYCMNKKAYKPVELWGFMFCSKFVFPVYKLIYPWSNFVKWDFQLTQSSVEHEKLCVFLTSSKKN